VIDRSVVGRSFVRQTYSLLWSTYSVVRSTNDQTIDLERWIRESAIEDNVCSYVASKQLTSACRCTQAHTHVASPLPCASGCVQFHLQCRRSGCRLDRSPWNLLCSQSSVLVGNPGLTVPHRKIKDTVLVAKGETPRRRYS
jgi:hypothetical protein